jgi:hypothetical protein
MMRKYARWALAAAVLSIPVVVFAAEQAKQADAGSSCAQCHQTSCHR